MFKADVTHQWFRHLDLWSILFSLQGERDAEHAAVERLKGELRQETEEVSPICHRDHNHVMIILLFRTTLLASMTYSRRPSRRRYCRRFDA